jgi:rhodanese-related sulfurtransferase
MRHLTPTDTWQFLQRTPEALFVDVRMEIEYLYVGHPPGVVHVAWYEYPEMQAHPEAFAQQVRREAGGRTDRPVVLICRSGKRTVEAGQALEAVVSPTSSTCCTASRVSLTSTSSADA